MISTSNLSTSVIEWKKKHLPGSFDDDQAALLGKKYWQNFKKSHPKIKQKEAVYFNANREDWCNFQKCLKPRMTTYTLPWLLVK
jgi:hypothetical protein